MPPPAMPALSSTWRCSISPAGPASTRTRRRFRFLRLRPGKRTTERRGYDLPRRVAAAAAFAGGGLRDPPDLRAGSQAPVLAPHVRRETGSRIGPTCRLLGTVICRRARSRNPRRAKTQVLMLSSDMAAPEVSAMERRGCALALAPDIRERAGAVLTSRGSARRSTPLPQT